MLGTVFLGTRRKDSLHHRVGRWLWLVALMVWAACHTEIAAPTANPGADMADVAVGTVVTLDGTRSSDPDNRALTFRWTFTNLPPGSAAVLSGAESPRPQFTVDKQGNYAVELVVTNGVAESDPATVHIAGGKCGTYSPTVDPITFNPAAPNAGQAVSFVTKVTHPDTIAPCKLQRTLSYAWTVSKAPPGSAAKVLGGNTLGASFIPDRDGAYEVTLTASDDLGRATSATGQLTVGNCGAQTPTIDPTKITYAPATPVLGSPVQLAVVVADGDTLPPCMLTESFSYEWQILSLPQGSTAKLNLTSASDPSFTPDKTGDYLIGVRVTDGEGHKSAQQSVKITIGTCGNNAPKVSDIVPSPATPNTNQLVQLAPTVVDPDLDPACLPNESFTYSWALVAAPAGSKAALNSLTVSNPSFTPDLTGSYVVRVTVTDSEGHKGPAFEKTITAAACGSNPPTASLGELVPAVTVVPGPAVVGARVGLGVNVQVSAASSTDADNTGLACALGQTFTYQWSFVELPTGSKSKLNNATVLAPTFQTDVPGKYVLGLVVTDSTNLTSAMATFTITADPAVNVNGLPGGFTVTSVVAGLAQGANRPRGVTRDPAFNIYFNNVGSNIIKKLSPAGSVTTFSANGFLNTVGNDNTVGAGLAFDPGSGTLFAAAGSTVGGEPTNLVRIGPTGVQQTCSNNWYRTLTFYPSSAIGKPVMIGVNRGAARLDYIDPASPTCNVINSNTLGGGLATIWGAAAFVKPGAPALDDVFGCDRAGVIMRNEGPDLLSNAGANTTIFNTSGPGNPNDFHEMVTTPCNTAGHPKVIAANQLLNGGGGGNLLIVPNVANSQPGKVIAANLNQPVGVYFEAPNTGGCNTATPCLLLSDEGYNAVFRITGDFCAL